MSEFKVEAKSREEQYKKMMSVLETYRAEPSDPSSALKAARMRSLFNGYRLTQAYKEDTKVAYVVEQFPNEIVFGFNMLSWNMESMAILLAQTVNVDPFINLTQEKSLSRDICSFLRGSLGVMLANGYPNPDLVMVNDQPCDCLAKVGNMSSKLYDCTFLSINTPNQINEDTLAYLVQQLKKLIADIESNLNIPFDEELFRQVVQYSNEARDYYCKTVELNKTYELPGVSRELLEIFGMNGFGLKENVQICKTLYEEALAISKQSDPNKKKKRILWAGQAPHNDHELIRYFEQQVEIVYWAPLWDANLVSLDPEDPLTSIAERAILYHWNAKRLKENISQVCTSFHIDGVVISNIWGCRNMMGISSMIREMSGEQGLKYLTISVDYVDKNNYAFNHVKNRIDAFLEIMSD
ncbi:Benzoyl-CoA reductase/2-hydroxyglutaryl-CoA dehydratase subunit, BcrC/BadD/HgdB [Paenibacillus tianmuensis]|uniref:Benzoyl-CoA reductase/2-hydroxyglutaryl-CoA dehydratase subunit, BcrC/BadD/HgdB n=1 Tax=Paenibacillus tianmuensis TaxID=624147 RepID=A0A1G4R8P6_9BACL|nr:2-hydroxyacyl-CoA dehydratase family protein [Paenibacillus tianmuensis]SCW53242.1 Benzoyl-CoA reductase/2-hydroxyglutaryl-CoA dehydratase subunit, BcrC/BadD/HgdB [Paenibacillus tianmuensis]